MKYVAGYPPIFYKAEKHSIVVGMLNGKIQDGDSLLLLLFLEQNKLWNNNNPCWWKKLEHDEPIRKLELELHWCT